MPTLEVGQTSIPYTVRHSARAKTLQMVVTSASVEVVAPEDTSSDQITNFLDNKRRWLFNAVEDCRAEATQSSLERYVSGAKLLYRGRRLMLQVEPAAIKDVSITCKSRFHIQVPRNLEGDARQQAIATALDTWMRDRAFHDAQRLTRFYARKLNVAPKAIRVSEQKHVWATCGKNKVIRINWQLVQAPLAAMEYVVAHEVTHLVHRHHNDSFWTMLGTIMPSWKERKTLLESWERANEMGK